jgi:glc operon protein GlcG
VTKSLTLADARQITEATLAEAARLGLRVSVVVVDAQAHEVSLTRMDGAPWFTPGVAFAKARSAATMGQDSASLAELRSDYPQLVPLIDEQLPFTLTDLEGGVVVQRDGTTLGAVAVSGALPAEDVACARAGIAVWRSAVDG